MHLNVKLVQFQLQCYAFRPLPVLHKRFLNSVSVLGLSNRDSTKSVSKRGSNFERTVAAPKQEKINPVSRPQQQRRGIEGMIGLLAEGLKSRAEASPQNGMLQLLSSFLQSNQHLMILVMQNAIFRDRRVKSISDEVDDRRYHRHSKYRRKRR